MSDIVRNDGESKKTKQTTRKEIKLDKPQEKKNTVQIHFGNVDILKLRLLETSCKNQVVIIKQLDEMLDHALMNCLTRTA